MKVRKDAFKNNKGFTLVELIVVMVILGILAALIVPSLIGYIDKSKDTQLITECRHCVEAAQVLATKKYAAGEDPETMTEAEILKYSEMPGQVTALASSDFEKSTLLHLTYSNYGRSVTYCRKGAACHGEVYNFNSWKTLSEQNLTGAEAKVMMDIIKQLINDPSSGYKITGSTGTIPNSALNNTSNKLFEDALKGLDLGGYTIGGHIKGYQGWVTKGSSYSGNSMVFYDRTLEEVNARLKDTSIAGGRRASYCVIYEPGPNGDDGKFYWGYTVEGQGMGSQTDNGMWAKSVAKVSDPVKKGPFDSFADCVAMIRKDWPDAFTNNTDPTSK